MIGMLPLIFVGFSASPRSSIKISNQDFTAATILRRGPIVAAVVVGAVSQGVMVLLMASTPLAMIGHGFRESATGDLIRWHVVALFAPSFLTGFLIKRLGTTPVVSLGLILVAALLSLFRIRQRNAA